MGKYPPLNFSTQSCENVFRSLPGFLPPDSFQFKLLNFFLRVIRKFRLIPPLNSLWLRIASFREDSARRKEIFSLIRSGEWVLLHPIPPMNSGELQRKIGQDVIDDFLSVYKTLPIQKDFLPETLVDSGPLTLLGHPLAIITIPKTHQAYLQCVGPKTRNMIRKSEKFCYAFSEFEWNDHLEDIFEINTSKATRQGRRMLGWYSKPVQPRILSNEEKRYLQFFGAFKEGKLVGYIHTVTCGDFVFFKHVLGHADHLPFGIMNGLTFAVVKHFINHPTVRFLKYGNLTKSNPYAFPMFSFRLHLGFRRLVTFLSCSPVRKDKLKGTICN